MGGADREKGKHSHRNGVFGLSVNYKIHLDLFQGNISSPDDLSFSNFDSSCHVWILCKCDWCCLQIRTKLTLAERVPVVLEEDFEIEEEEEEIDEFPGIRIVWFIEINEIMLPNFKRAEYSRVQQTAQYTASTCY